MQKINFQNLPNTTTPINATNLNAIQTNAENAINSVANDLTTTNGNVSTLNTKVTNQGTYSENETVIGTWINGKPIYRKVITFTPSSSAMESSHSHGISNVDDFLPTCSCILYRTNGAIVPFSMVYPSGNSSNGIVQWSIGWQVGSSIVTWIGDNMRGQIDTSRGYGAMAILEYTKTTD